MKNLQNNTKRINEEEIRRMAKKFLYAPVQKTSVVGYVLHPFFESTYMELSDNVTLNLLDKADEETAKDYMGMAMDMIDLDTLFRSFTPMYIMIFLNCVEEFLDTKTFSRWLRYGWLHHLPNPDIPATLSVNEIMRLFKKADKRILMNKSEFAAYKKLPKTVTLFGVESNSDIYMPWSRNYKVVKELFDLSRIIVGSNDNTTLSKAEIPKEQVLAVFMGTDIDEVVFDRSSNNKVA